MYLPVTYRYNTWYTGDLLFLSSLRSSNLNCHFCFFITITIVMNNYSLQHNYCVSTNIFLKYIYATTKTHTNLIYILPTTTTIPTYLTAAALRDSASTLSLSILLLGHRYLCTLASRRRDAPTRLNNNTRNKTQQQATYQPNH